MATFVATELEPSQRKYESRQYARIFPKYDQPRIVGSFSVDSKRRCLLNDRRHLQFVRRCPSPNEIVHLDLAAGFENAIRKPLSNERIDQLLRFIVGNVELLRNRDEKCHRMLNANVVCFRGLMRLLMATPYERKEGWHILATRFKGTVYLCAWESEAQLAERLAKENSPNMKRIFSYGFKFEQYRQTRVRNEEPSTTGPVNEAEEFCCMFEGKLQATRLLFGAEMDGVDEDEDVDLDTVDLNTVRFVELKVNKRATQPWQKRTFYQFKTRNWWSQCYLAGIQQLQVGERNDAGIVDNLYTCDVRTLVQDSKV